MEVALLKSKEINLEVVNGDREFSLSRELDLAKEDLKASIEYNRVLDLEKLLQEEQKRKEEERKKILELMKENEIDKFTLGDYLFKIKKGKKGRITVVNLDPVTLHRMKPDLVTVKYEVNKTKIKEALEEGIYIENCYIEETRGEDTLEITTTSNVAEIVSKINKRG